MLAKDIHFCQGAFGSVAQLLAVAQGEECKAKAKAFRASIGRGHLFGPTTTR